MPENFKLGHYRILGSGAVSAYSLVLCELRGNFFAAFAVKGFESPKPQHDAKIHAGRVESRETHRALTISPGPP